VRSVLKRAIQAEKSPAVWSASPVGACLCLVQRESRHFHDNIAILYLFRKTQQGRCELRFENGSRHTPVQLEKYTQILGTGGSTSTMAFGKLSNQLGGEKGQAGFSPSVRKSAI